MKQQRELSRESSRCFIRYTLFMGIQATTHYPPPGRSNELGAIFDYRIQATTHYPPAGLPDPLLPELLGCCPCCGCCA